MTEMLQIPNCIEAEESSDVGLKRASSMVEVKAKIVKKKKEENEIDELNNVVMQLFKEKKNGKLT